MVSRSDSREDFVNLQKAFNENLSKVATLRAVRNADTKRWTTTDLNLWTEPGKGAKKIGLLQEEKKILVTGRRTGDIAVSFADPSLALRELGWTARHGLADMCRDTWKWQTEMTRSA